MNKKLMITVPIMAAVLTIGAGAGVVYAKNIDLEPTYQPVSNYAVTAPTDTNTQPTLGYCGGLGGMQGLGAGQGLMATRVADLLGTTVDDLWAQLDSGKTLAEIAAVKGVTQDQLVQTIMAPMNDQMALMLKYDTLTQAQIDSMTEQMQTRIQTMTTTQLKSTDQSGFGFGPNMMQGLGGGMMNNNNGAGMMNGNGGGMMGRNNGGMTGSGNPQAQPSGAAQPQTPAVRGGMMGTW